ncbi:MAG: substrate-binding domain-containing protein [Chloroflexota bacterium]|nr:substrate-binding domain-containing protein [Chloroflexota bacterium]
MVNRRLLALASAAVVAFGACTGGGASSSPSTPASVPPSVAPSVAPSTTAGCTVGVSWNNYQEERWAKWDEPAIKKAVEDAGGTYVPSDAKSSAATQATNIENMIAQGAQVLIILVQDADAIKPSVDSAISQGIPVIAYDRLIEDARALYVTFDNVEVGRMQAREIFKAVPKGQYAIIKGNNGDANANFLRSGMEEIIGAAVTSGDIVIGGRETYTDNWDPAKAQTEMEQFLTASNNKIDAVLSENDGMAGGVIAALKAQGLDGKVPVSGQDGDIAALNRVALGTQTVDVWKDARELGKAAGTAAIQLCGGTAVGDITGAAPFDTPGKNKVSSILLKPIPITKDNLQVVLDAKWITKDALCQGVTAGSVKGC